MKILLIILGVVFYGATYAGGMRKIPVQLMELEHQGRAKFVQNALSELSLSMDQTRYHDFKSIVVAGDERGSDFTGALFIYEVKLSSAVGRYQEYQCHQYLPVGNFDQSHIRPIVCKEL